jgi:hypothetical protein
MENDEQPDWNTAWDEVNRQLSIQTGTVDPSWITNKEYKNFFKTIIKQTK